MKIVRRLGFVVIATAATLLCTLALTFNWAYSQAFDTSQFVSTADTIYQDPSVQQEIAQTLVASLVGDTELPAVITKPLTTMTTELVSSETFHTFWVTAVEKIHQPLMKQLQSDAPLGKAAAVRVDLTEIVNTVLDDIRQKYPQASALLPTEAPLTEYQLLDADNMSTARDVVHLLSAIRWILFVLAIALLAGTSFLAHHSVRTTAFTAAVGATIAYIASFIVPILMQSAASTEHQDTARAIGLSLASPLRMNSLVVLLIGVGIAGASYVRQLRSRLQITP